MLPSDGVNTPTAAIPCPRPTSPHALLALPSQGEWVATARRFTTDLLRSWKVTDEDQESAVLIVDELTVNAVQHGHADTTLAVALEDGMLLIAVADSGACVSHQPAEGFDPDEHGRGTHIVEFLAHRMHVQLEEHGCRVSVALRVAADDPSGQR
ncbi:ATP-binding protein [Streptomyces albipurpureus]|uniref:ATP-binding protein n=1 Tax=Streptomyces albipurpureus TaxID=2897419 RepID=A0ABT0UQL3_9ACTN|nr:ATP-binding protein [Streptomyces sp. CWNU-1]MCM2389678.1 ATP-binding protein [Streptomyces sp. CWNU-1]